jgi:hypothetical protein
VLSDRRRRQSRKKLHQHVTGGSGVGHPGLWLEEVDMRSHEFLNRHWRFAQMNR